MSLIRAVDSSLISWRGLAVFDGATVDPTARARLEAILPVGVGADAARTLADDCDLIISWAVEDFGPLLSPDGPRPKVAYCDHFPHDSPWNEMAAWCLREVDAIVGVSEFCEPGWPASSPARRSVIWNAVDPDRLVATRTRAEVRGSWGVPLDAPVVGYYSRLAFEKRPDAAARLAAELPDPWHVVAIGSGRERPALERAKAEMGDAGRRFLILPPDPNPGDVLPAFDSILVPPEFESFGLTMAEAFALGVPAISTEVGLARLVPGLTRIVPLDADGPTLAAAVLADRSDPDGTARRVERARRFARERLSIDRFGREWTDLMIGLAEPRASKLGKVAACPARGPVLPLSMQDDCGCRGRELSECRDGMGTVPGRVSLRDCLACRG